MRIALVLLFDHVWSNSRYNKHEDILNNRKNLDIPRHLVIKVFLFVSNI